MFNGVFEMISSGTCVAILLGWMTDDTSRSVRSFGYGCDI
jgi:hypothetical protein